MADIEETELPGIGVRYDLRIRAARRIGVLVHRTGRRDLLVYDRTDPDLCTTSLALDEDEAHTLAEMLGPSPVVTRLAAMQQEIEGLAIDWIAVDPASSLAGSTLRQAAIQTRTGSSIVAILRGTETMPSPRADDVIAGDDILVAVGTVDGVRALEVLARP
jgi:TrkA domain protein